MVCDSTRKEFPFDVHPKSMIPYKTDSKSNFDDLESKIKNKLCAYIEQQPATLPMVTVQLQDVQGLQSFESSLLAIIIGEQKQNSSHPPYIH